LKTVLPEADFGKAIQRLSALQRRRGDLSTAVRLWEQAAAEGHIFAHVELAKYYEHTRKDPAAALEWTLSAFGHVRRADLPAYIRKHWLEELEHRQNRLQEKLGKQA
jgi:TPR repeat protein